MSISRKFASDQVKRLAGTEYFAALSDEAIIELKRAMETAPNEVIATVVINDWLATQRQRPTPADLHTMIEAHKPKDIRVDGINFNQWVAQGNPKNFDAFLEWAVSGTEKI
jgi:hypothetical protein